MTNRKSRSSPFYVYGEGSITHGDEPCPEGIGVHHPQIERTAWPSRWAYYRSRLAVWWELRWMRWIARSGYFRQQKAAGITRDYVANLPQRPLDRLLFRVLGDPSKRRECPTVWAPLRPEDSIYPSAIERAAWWAERRSES